MKVITTTLLCFLVSTTVKAQTAGTPEKGKKKISSDLFGLFFEDINYAGTRKS